MLQPQQQVGIDADFPEAFGRLFEQSRYKVCHGGRGGGRSWAIARALLIRGVKEPGLRVLCCRELQKSIKDSVHQLLKDQITLLGLDAYYLVLQNEIRGPGGTMFLFYGLRNNPTEIKSTEGLDLVWVEEAHNVRKSSWETLIPTIRKNGSEIWISFNRQLDTDETDQRFLGKGAPNEHTIPKSIVIKTDWRDNPWFPDVLRQEMELLAKTDPDAYQNIWLGEPRKNLAGAVYAKQLRELRARDGICEVPYEKLRPVDAFWDLGRADATAVWFAQYVGFQVRVLRYYENQGEDLEFYLQYLAKLPYLWGTMWLPHDAKARRLGQKKSVQQQFIEAGFKARIVPSVSLHAGIEAGRAYMAKCWFDETLTADGLQALSHYRYDIVPGTNTFSNEPLHDWASHGADAWRYMALAMRDPKRDADRKKTLRESLAQAATNIVEHGWLVRRQAVGVLFG